MSMENWKEVLRECRQEFQRAIRRVTSANTAKAIPRDAMEGVTNRLTPLIAKLDALLAQDCVTDLEITKRCAEKMGIIVNQFPGGNVPDNFQYLLCASDNKPYDPLHDDAQMVALVKKFRLQLDPHSERWNVAAVDRHSASQQENLNRAVCECVASLP